MVTPSCSPQAAAPRRGELPLGDERMPRATQPISGTRAPTWKSGQGVHTTGAPSFGASVEAGHARPHDGLVAEAHALRLRGGAGGVEEQRVVGRAHSPPSAGRSPVGPFLTVAVSTIRRPRDRSRRRSRAACNLGLIGTATAPSSATAKRSSTNSEAVRQQQADPVAGPHRPEADVLGQLDRSTMP